MRATQGIDPRDLLSGCHPDLAKIAWRAAQLSSVPFKIDYGARTLADEKIAVATGHSQTLHSRHLPDPKYGNKAMAFDFCVLGPDDKPDWNTPGNYPIVGAAMLEAAHELGIKAQWGGMAVGAWTDGVVSDWRDWGHVQLDPSAYPSGLPIEPSGQ